MRFLPKIQKPVSTTRQRAAFGHRGLVDRADVPVGRLDVEAGEVGRRGHEDLHRGMRKIPIRCSLREPVGPRRDTRRATRAITTPERTCAAAAYD